MNSKLILLVLGFIGAVCAQSDPSVSDVLSQLPPEYQDKVNSTQIEDIKNKSAAVFKEKCEKNAGPGVFDEVQKAYTEFPSCVKNSLNLHDPSVLQKEIEDAKPNGTVDEVFKKYCAKAPKVKNCFNDTLQVLKPCFSGEEQKNIKIIYNVTEQLADFVCYKEGDRIALFIAEGGPECYQEKVEQIQDCVNQTFGSSYKFNASDITANTIPQIEFGEKECRQMNELQNCVVTALQSCQTPTSANIVESLFKFARKATPCADKVIVVSVPRARTRNETSAPGSASGLAIMSTTVFMAVTMSFLF